MRREELECDIRYYEQLVRALLQDLLIGVPDIEPVLLRMSHRLAAAQHRLERHDQGWQV